MRPASPGLGAGLALLLGACGDISNDPLREGDVTGEVLRADKDVGKVVLLGEEPKHQDLEEDGRFRFSSIPGGDQELLVVANATEAIRVPVYVVPRDTADLGTIDPRPGAFLRVDLVTTSRRPADYRLWIERTHLEALAASEGTSTFHAGPLGAGCYFGVLTRGVEVAWRAEVCLSAGETRVLTVMD